MTKPKWVERFEGQIKFSEPPFEIKINGKIIDDLLALKKFISQAIVEELKRVECEEAVMVHGINYQVNQINRNWRAKRDKLIKENTL